MRLKWFESLPLRPIVVIASVSSTSPSCPHLYRLIAAIPSQTARSRPKSVGSRRGTPMGWSKETPS